MEPVSSKPAQVIERPAGEALDAALAALTDVVEDQGRRLLRLSQGRRRAVPVKDRYCCRARRRQPSQPSNAKAKPGKPAPTIGPGTGSGSLITAS